MHSLAFYHSIPLALGKEHW